eukprot:3060020-Prymnesium_polylepis.2
MKLPGLGRGSQERVGGTKGCRQAWWARLTALPLSSGRAGLTRLQRHEERHEEVPAAREHDDDAIGAGGGRKRGPSLAAVHAHHHHERDAVEEVEPAERQHLLVEKGAERPGDPCAAHHEQLAHVERPLLPPMIPQLPPDVVARRKHVQHLERRHERHRRREDKPLARAEPRELLRCARVPDEDRQRRARVTRVLLEQHLVLRRSDARSCDEQRQQPEVLLDKVVHRIVRHCRPEELRRAAVVQCERDDEGEEGAHEVQ